MIADAEIEYMDEPVTVYNFEVMDWGTYYVSGMEVLVHNKCSDETSYEKSSIKLPIINGKVNGLIPVDEYLEIRNRSLQNAESGSMTLGKYLRNTETGEVSPEAYTEMAKKYGDTYFDLGAEWDVIKRKYGISDADMFELFNIPALDYAVESGKTIRFSQNPTLPMYKDSALADEWNYLKMSHGYIDLKKEGEFWYAIK